MKPMSESAFKHSKTGRRWAEIIDWPVHSGLDSVLQQSAENAILLDRVGVNALETAHRQLGYAVG